MTFLLLKIKKFKKNVQINPYININKYLKTDNYLSSTHLLRDGDEWEDHQSHCSGEEAFAQSGCSATYTPVRSTERQKAYQAVVRMGGVFYDPVGPDR